ncbi:DUF1707 domain-containing protein [Corynebacterium lizhenjunii]|uniref:DUF1707 SHOCT-like domain-containing protein n=1 Tax=Corynebacterium lizhenjunii TaxID=2709394 RepID=UPI001F16BDB5|nr:DUF1707 domain-containing protein [Corynebacterium lizhenjunii]
MGRVTNDYGASPFSNSLRLSDADRTDAMNQLARAVGEGRLSMAEFEERSDDIMRATTRRDLVPLFADIPAQSTTELKVYSQADVNRARAAGKKPRLATALTGTLALLFGAIAAIVAASSGAGIIAGLTGTGLLFCIPILWILLYVAKIGPDSWNVPSPRKIEKQRQREIAAATAYQRAEQKAIESQLWAQRRQQAGELTGEALKLAREKFSQKFSSGH